MNRVRNKTMQSIRGAVLIWFSAVFAGLLIIPAPAHADIDIVEVTSTSGVSAWLVEDYTVPLVAVEFAFRGGSVQDPLGKEGLASLMTGLFDEGAGEFEADAFQDRLDEVGVEMSFSARPDAIHGSVRMLAETRAEAVELVRLAVNQPRFDDPAFQRIRSQLVGSIRASERNPRTQASIRWAETLYGDHPYARREEGTPETLLALTPDDLRELHARLFAKGELHVAIVGAIDPASAGELLDRIFGELPEEPQLAPVEDARINFGETLHVEYDLPQSTLAFAWPGIERSDPEFFAAYLMNHILGGGTFSSWLYTEVREKRGLAYGVSSYLSNSEHAASLMVSTATQSGRVEETFEVIRGEVGRMVENGPTEEELEAAKKTVIGGYAVSNLTSSGSVARTLLELQLEDLGIDYMDRRTELIGQVNLEEVRSVASRIFTTEPSIMILGPSSAESR